MKIDLTDLNAVKKELSRLTDMKYLKKEINRIATDVKKFRVHRHLNPQARKRLQTLEGHFQDLLNSFQTLQKQVDSNLENLLKTMRGLGRGKAPKRASKKKTSAKKATTKRATKTKKKTARA